MYRAGIYNPICFADPADPRCDRCGQRYLTLKGLERHINERCPYAGGANDPADCQTCSGERNPKTGRPTKFVHCYRCSPVGVLPAPEPCPACAGTGKVGGKTPVRT